MSLPPPPPPPGAPYVPPREAGTSGLAVASMVLGILWLWWIGSVLAVIFGHVALGQISHSNGRLGGRGMAIAGLVLGYIGLFFLARHHLSSPPPERDERRPLPRRA